MSLGPAEIGLILLGVLLLFGYKKLPDAARAFGRSLRIFKGEMQDMRGEGTTGQAAPTTADVTGGSRPAGLGSVDPAADQPH
jgi:sec-independent protein translocase protein TatA